ncbi:MAG: cardiolipin synthetase (Cardiolipin synthase)-like protein [Ramlibacter sp.]|nr:cardiolipin synthetase (Cardiolipin synthase)-like protein [Ramlibacter sp.]
MAHRIPPLRQGHRLDLLQGSRELFPALIDAIDGARSEVLFETYIFDTTGSGVDVAYALERAARRGVSVMLVVDGFGSGPLPPFWQERFAQAGVQWRVFSPPGRFGLLWPGNWRRLHRKLCVVDSEIAFCGGINILDDYHDPNYGTLESPRFDFAVRVTGPLVAQVQATMVRLWQRMRAVQGVRQVRLAGVLDSLRATRPAPLAATPAPAPAGERRWAKAALVLRDNVRNRTGIERAYRRAIAGARSEVIIANAYFVPGRKMRNALVRAARRGVTVQLLLQGRYEYFMQYYAARPIYGVLLAAGVQIHEYSPSFLHAKVAVIDGEWSTVGSSNLDPLSLLLAREANVMVQDAAFSQLLRSRLVLAMATQGKRMDPEVFARRPMRQRVGGWVAFVLMRLVLAVQGKKYL